MLFDIAGIDYFKERYVTENLERKLEKYANMLLGGVFTVGYDSIQSVSFNVKEVKSFDWNFSNESVTNTFLLYAYGLRPVYILVKVFQKTKSQEYLSLAWKFISSFYSYLKSSEVKNPFVFNDHAMAERVENIIYFGHILTQFNIELPNQSAVRYLLEDCCKKLESKKYYQTNHNHGIIVDKALIIGAYCLNDKNTSKRIDHAISRLKKQIQFAFGIDGAHVENSIDYHVLVTELISGIESSLIFIKHPYAIELKAVLEKTYEFMTYFHKPNLHRPLIGDSKGTRDQERVVNINTFKNEYLEYINSFGNKGQKPKKLTSNFYDSGYVFLREHFEPENFKDATWISIKAGYKTRTHKHQDDLSICLYSKGYDIFIDPGMYNFVPKDRYKDYLESIPAHTTVGIVNKPYSIASGNGEKFKIQIVKQFAHYDYVLASSRVYKDCAIYRHLYYFRGANIVVIRDEIFSQKEELFAQYFHLGPMIKIQEISPNRAVLQIGDSGFSVVMQQLKGADLLKIAKGTDTEPMSIVSTGFSEYIDTETIHFYKKMKCGEFITSIEIKNGCDALDEEMDKVKLEGERIVVADGTISLESSIPVAFYGIGISCDDLMLRVKNHIHPDVHRQFALYLYDHNSRNVVAKLPYTTNEYIEYKFKDVRDYDLLYYVSNGKGEMIKGIVATLRQKAGKLYVDKVYDQLHVPETSDMVVKKNGNKYTFRVPIKYDFPFQTRWWIYRNGVNLKCVALHGKDEFHSELSHSGDYVIMCSASDFYFGEFYFGQSEVISIEDHY